MIAESINWLMLTTLLFIDWLYFGSVARSAVTAHYCYCNMVCHKRGLIAVIIVSVH